MSGCKKLWDQQFSSVLLGNPPSGGSGAYVRSEKHSGSQQADQEVDIASFHINKMLSQDVVYG